MSDTDLDSCNGMAKWTTSGWMPVRQDSAGQFYSPRGPLVPVPSEFKSMTPDDIRADLKAHNEVYVGHFGVQIDGR